MLGQKIGNYRLVRLLGTGGMGMVYESIHDGIGGRAAIKVLRPEIASNEDTTQRFFSEARAANLIAHPGIVHIFDCGYTSSGIAYLTMEFLEGETLKQRLDRQRVLSVSDALRLLRQVALALQSAHARSVIHRDLKPDKITPVEKWLSFFRRPSEKVAEVLVTHWLSAKNPKRRSKQDHQTWISG